jgi:RNA polymerase sigma-70 factor (ECF subfamily)
MPTRVLAARGFVIRLAPGDDYSLSFKELAVFRRSAQNQSACAFLTEDEHRCHARWMSSDRASLQAGEVGELFRLHGPMVYRRAFRLLGRREDADEAVQEVFIRVMRGASSFEGRSGVTTWLYQITTHYCLNLLRDRARRQQLLQENFEPNEVQASATPSELVLLRRLLAEADEQQARAAIYVYLDGMSHEEAAGVLGVSKRTVGNLIDRFLAWANQRSAPIGEATPTKK